MVLSFVRHREGTSGNPIAGDAGGCQALSHVLRWLERASSAREAWPCRRGKRGQLGGAEDTRYELCFTRLWKSRRKTECVWKQNILKRMHEFIMVYILREFSHLCHFFCYKYILCDLESMHPEPRVESLSPAKGLLGQWQHHSQAIQETT